MKIKLLSRTCYQPCPFNMRIKDITKESNSSIETVNLTGAWCESCEYYTKLNDNYILCHYDTKIKLRLLNENLL